MGLEEAVSLGHTGRRVVPTLCTYLLLLCGVSQSLLKNSLKKLLSEHLQTFFFLVTISQII